VIDEEAILPTYLCKTFFANRPAFGENTDFAQIERP